MYEQALSPTQQLPQFTPASYLDDDEFALDFATALNGDSIDPTFAPVVTIVPLTGTASVPTIEGVGTEGTAVIAWLAGGAMNTVFVLTMGIRTATSGRKIFRSALVPIQQFVG